MRTGKGKGKSKSPASRLAKVRNFTILRLRGMYQAFDSLQCFDESDKKEGLKIIDRALVNLQAQPETERRFEERQKVKEMLL